MTVILEREVREGFYKKLTFELKHPEDRINSTFYQFLLLLLLPLLLFVYLVPAKIH